MCCFFFKGTAATEIYPLSLHDALPISIWTDRQVNRLLERVMVRVEDGAMVVASGSLPPGVSDDFYIRLNTALERKNARMVLDTSEDALMTSVKSVVRPYAVLRMDRLEAEFLAGQAFPTPTEMVDFAQKMVNDNIADVVVLARGADGSVFASKTERFHVRPPKTAVRSAVGAGDSLVGGLTLALSQSRSLEEAGLLAAAAASSAVQTGASDLCIRSVTEEIMKNCILDRSEEHTSELQSRRNLVCRLLLEKKKETKKLFN
mgnify:CR=1 FL=1